MTETNQVKLTLEEKERLADYWAKRLQLDDWDIKFNLNLAKALVDKTPCPVAVAEGDEVTADEEA